MANSTTSRQWRPLLVIGLLVLLLGFLLLIAKNSNEDAVSDETADSSLDSSADEDKTVYEADTKSTETHLDGDSNLSGRYPGDPQALQYNEEARLWLRKRGFTNEYNTYFLNRDFLENQVLAGDMLAAQLLGYQMLGSEEGDRYLENAVRWGSIQALHFLSASFQAKTDGRVKLVESDTPKPDLQKQYGVSALAYLFVSDMRGAGGTAAFSIEELMEKVTYTDQDIVNACEQAKELYLEFEQARKAEGLGPFDNSPIPGVDPQSSRADYCS